jgi:hypothetical protein
MRTTCHTHPTIIDSTIVIIPCEATRCIHVLFSFLLVLRIRRTLFWNAVRLDQCSSLTIHKQEHDCRESCGLWHVSVRRNISESNSFCTHSLIFVQATITVTVCIALLCVTLPIVACSCLCTFHISFHLLLTVPLQDSHFYLKILFVTLVYLLFVVNLLNFSVTKII